MVGGAWHYCIFVYVSVLWIRQKAGSFTFWWSSANITPVPKGQVLPQLANYLRAVKAPWTTGYCSVEYVFCIIVLCLWGSYCFIDVHSGWRVLVKPQVRLRCSSGYFVHGPLLFIIYTADMLLIYLTVDRVLFESPRSPETVSELLRRDLVRNYKWLSVLGMKLDWAVPLQFPVFMSNDIVS